MPENQSNLDGHQTSISNTIIIGAILAQFVEGAWFLIVAAFSLPIGVLTYLLISAYLTQYDTRNLELRGDSLQRPLMETLTRVRTAENVLQGCESDKCAREAANQASLIGASLNQAVDQNARYAADLHTTYDDLAKKNRQDLSLVELKNRWRALAETRANLADPAERTKLSVDYERLAQRVKWLIDYVGDSSHLILDPDLDSYYLVDVTLLTIPDMVGRIAGIAAIANKVVSGDGSEAEKALLESQSDELQESVDRVAASSDSAFGGDTHHDQSPTLERNLRPALQQYQTALLAYSETLKTIRADSSPVSAAALAAQTMALQNAGLDYWNAAATELDVILEMRCKELQNHCLYAFVFSTSFLLLAVAFVLFVSRATTKPIYGLIRTLAKTTKLPGVSPERMAEAVQSMAPRPEQTAIGANDTRQSVLELARKIEDHGTTRVTDKDNTSTQP